MIKLGQDPKWRDKVRQSILQLTKNPTWIKRNKEIGRENSNSSKWRQKIRDAKAPRNTPAFKEAMVKRALNQKWLRHVTESNKRIAKDPEWQRKNKLVRERNLRNPECLSRMGRGKKGRIWSKKKEQYIFYASQLERDWILELDRDPAVSSFDMQPQDHIITYASKDGKRHNYLPDVLVHCKDGRKELWEIKPDPLYFRLHPTNVVKWRAAKKWCQDQAITFRVVGYKLLNERK